MKQIRIGTFETNSSSTHTLVIVSEEEYNKFKNGELLFDRNTDKLVAKEEIIAEIKKYNKDEEITEDMIEEDTWTFDRLGGSYFETFERVYETKNGEKIVAFGYFGYDG